jgi:hypothetical protein
VRRAEGSDSGGLDSWLEVKEDGNLFLVLDFWVFEKATD